MQARRGCRPARLPDRPALVRGNEPPLAAAPPHLERGTDVSAQSVKAREIRIIALEEEIDSHKVTVKRCQDEIKLLRKEQRKQILNPNQGELKLTQGKKKTEATKD